MPYELAITSREELIKLISGQKSHPLATLEAMSNRELEELADELFN